MQFDLRGLYALRPRLPRALMPPCDACVVSDVLYLLAPPGWSPWIYWDLMPVSFDLARKRRFLDHCRKLAARLLMVSAHQNKPSILHLLETHGGFQRKLRNFYVLELSA